MFFDYDWFDAGGGKIYLIFLFLTEDDDSRKIIKAIQADHEVARIFPIKWEVYNIIH